MYRLYVSISPATVHAPQVPTWRIYCNTRRRNKQHKLRAGDVLNMLSKCFTFFERKSSSMAKSSRQEPRSDSGEEPRRETPHLAPAHSKLSDLPTFPRPATGSHVDSSAQKRDPSPKTSTRMRQFAERKFHSSQASVLGVHTESRVGAPVCLPPSGSIRPVLPTPATPPSPDQVPLPARNKPFSASRQSLIDSSIQASFVPGTKAVHESTKTIHEQDPSQGSICAVMESDEKFRGFLGGLFNTPQSSPALEALHTALMDAVSAGAHSARGPFEKSVLLAEALRGAVGTDADRAIKALGQLRTKRFLPPDTNPEESAETGQAKLDALHTAQMLVDTGVGMDTLLAAFRTPLPEALHEPMQFIIQAAERIMAEQPGLALASFPRIVEHARNAAGTALDSLACKVLRAEVNNTSSSHNQPTGLSQADKSAIFSWRQGFREDGKNSLLSRTQQRLAKFRKYVARTERRQEMLQHGLDPQTPLESTKSALNSALHIAGNHVQRAVGKKKNPLYAMNKYGALAADLQHPHKDQPLLDAHLTTAIHELMAHLAVQLPEATAATIQARPQLQLRDFLQDVDSIAPATPTKSKKTWSARLASMAKKPFHYRRPTPAVKQDDTTGIPVTQLRLAVLAQWAERSQEQRPHGLTLDAHDVKAIHRRLQAAMEGSCNRSASIPDVIKNLEGMALTHATLEQWGKESGIAAHGEVGATAESKFANAMRRTRNILHPERNIPGDHSANAMRKFLKDFVLEHNGGNTMTFSDGSSLGVNTGSLSVNVALAAAKVARLAATPSLDFRGSKTRSAVFNIGTSSAIGGEIFLGRQNQIAGQLGIGGIAAFSAPSIPHHKAFAASASATANATLLAWERTNPVGVRLRFVAKRNADGKLDYPHVRKQMNNMVDYLFDACSPAKRHMTPTELWEDFSNHHFDDRNLSVSWQDYVTTTTKAGAAIGASAKVGVKVAPKTSIKASGSMGYGFNATLGSKTRRTERSGNHPVMRNDHGRSHDQLLSLGGTLGMPFSALPNSIHGQPNSLGGSLLSASASFLLENGGFGATFRSILDNGRFSETFTLRDISERNVKDFLALANEPSHRAQWEQLCTAAEGGDAALGKARLDLYLTRIKEMARPHQGYYMRYRLRTETLGKVDVLWQSFQAARKSGRHKDMQARCAEMETLMKQENSWVPNALFVMHNNTKQSTTGLNFGIQATVQTSATSERELEFIGLPITIADAWAQSLRS